MLLSIMAWIWYPWDSNGPGKDLFRPEDSNHMIFDSNLNDPRVFSKNLRKIHEKMVVGVSSSQK